MLRILIFVFIVSVGTVFPQHNESLTGDGRVDVDKPTVYLEYICQDSRNVTIRMLNNTSWHIYVEAGKSYFPTKAPIILRNGAKVFAIPNSEIVPVLYFAERDELERKTLKPPSIEYDFVNGGGWIASKDSIVFEVALRHLKKGLKVYVGFSYEWEIPQSGNTRKEPEHRVYFRGGDIGSANTGIVPTQCHHGSVRNSVSIL